MLVSSIIWFQNFSTLIGFLKINLYNINQSVNLRGKWCWTYGLAVEMIKIFVLGLEPNIQVNLIFNDISSYNLTMITRYKNANNR